MNSLQEHKKRVAKIHVVILKFMTKMIDFKELHCKLNPCVNEMIVCALQNLKKINVEE